jgi:Cu+-exporting ATPase
MKAAAAPHSTAGTAVRPVAFGALAGGALLAVYFSVLSLVSGWSYTLLQFGEYWYYLTPLAAGFGAQVGLYVYLKQLIVRHHARQVVATTGATSTAAMVACCAHYLTNILPVIGVAGAVTLIADYQIELFWVGLAFNLAGLAYIGRKVYLGRTAACGRHA